MSYSRSMLAVGVLFVTLTQSGCSTFFGGSAGDSLSAADDPASQQFDGGQGLPPPQARPGRARMGVAGERFEKKPNEDGLLGGIPKPSKIAADAKRSVGFGPNAREAEELYSKADALYRAGEFSDARKLFKKAGATWPDSSLEEDAMFMAAESEFFGDDYPDASDGYANLLEKYENSRHLDTVVSRQFAIARYWLDLQQADHQPFFVPNVTNQTKPWWDTTGNAHAVMQSVWINDPTGPLADDSVLATANDYFVRGRFADADEYYQQLRQDYPKSEHLANAFLLGIQAKLATYQGADYDDTPLMESEKLIEQALLQFPAQLASERERILETRQTILKLKAERNWFKGEYFAGTKHYRSARHYYQQILRNAPNTEIAAMAQARLDEYADEPGVPTSRFQWFIDLFPESNSKSVVNTASAPSPGSSRR